MSAPGLITDTMVDLRTVKDAAGKEYTYRGITPIQKLQMVAESAKRARNFRDRQAISGPETAEEAIGRGRILPQHYELALGKDAVKRRELAENYKKGIYLRHTDRGFSWAERPENLF
jgi:hypothetical protein